MGKQSTLQKFGEHSGQAEQIAQIWGGQWAKDGDRLQKEARIINDAYKSVDAYLVYTVTVAIEFFVGIMQAVPPLPTQLLPQYEPRVLHTNSAAIGKCSPRGFFPLPCPIFLQPFYNVHLCKCLPSISRGSSPFHAPVFYSLFTILYNGPCRPSWPLKKMI